MIELCSCNHFRDEHNGYKECYGQDSYGCRCTCQSFELDPNGNEKDED